MAGISIQDDVSGFFERLITAGADLTVPLTAIGLGWDAYVQEQFYTGTDPYGNSWLPSIRSQAENGVPLTDIGNLRDSFSPNVTNNQLIYGSGLDYAAIHHFGGNAGKGGKSKIDARPILPGDGWPTDWAEEAADMVELYFAGLG